MNKNNEHYTIYNYAIQYNYTVNKKRSEQRIIIVEYLLCATRSHFLRDIYSGVSPEKNLEGRFRAKRGKKEEGRKEGNISKKEGKYFYFFPCLIQALMNAKKFAKNMAWHGGGGKGFFLVAIIYTPAFSSSNGFDCC